MTEPRFTPGPWRVRDGIPATDVEVVGCLIAKAYGCLAENERSSEAIMRSYAEASANASLISAAPDLYAALNGLLGTDFHQHPYDFTEDWHKAAAALAKARGESA